MGCGDEKLSKYLTQTFTAHCNAMICQQVTLSGDAEWPKVADAVIEALPQKGLVRFSHLSSRPKCWARVVNWVSLGSMHASILLKDQDGVFPQDSQCLFFVLM